MTGGSAYPGQMDERERFVPRRVGKITNELAELPWDSASDEGAFRSFSRLASALYHFEFHEREQAIVDSWELMADDTQAAAELRAALDELLIDANYTEVGLDEIEDALENEGLIPLRLEVDLDDYEELLICRRDSRTEDVEIPKWKGLRTEQKTITVEGRVVVLAKVRPQEWFEEHDIDPEKRNLKPGHVSLKQFQHVPRADIEMLLPSTQVRYRLIDTLLVGIPALVSGIVVLATKLLPTIGLMMVLAGAWLGVRDDEPELDQAALVVLFGGLVTVGGFMVRQWTKLKNRRVDYLKTLSEALYFRTLADGPGVLHILLSSAEQQEVVEVLLAYRFLLAAPDGLTQDELDRRVEEWLAEHCNADIDFEVDDALDKLRELEIVVTRDVGGAEHLAAQPLDEALAQLDRRWDDLFQHQGDEPVMPTAGAHVAGAGTSRG